MIVADTNLVAYLVIPGVSTQLAERVRAKDRIWVAPPLLRHELLNVVGTCVRENVLDRDEALRTYRRGLATVAVSDLLLDPLAILNLATSAGCTTYDAEYVWLAQELGVALVTADKQLITAFPSTAINFDQAVSL